MASRNSPTKRWRIAGTVAAVAVTTTAGGVAWAATNADPTPSPSASPSAHRRIRPSPVARRTGPARRVRSRPCAARRVHRREGRRRLPDRRDPDRRGDRGQQGRDHGEERRRLQQGVHGHGRHPGQRDPGRHHQHQDRQHGHRCRRSWRTASPPRPMSATEPSATRRTRSGASSAGLVDSGLIHRGHSQRIARNLPGVARVQA